METGFVFDTAFLVGTFALFCSFFTDLTFFELSDFLGSETFFLLTTAVVGLIVLTSVDDLHKDFRGLDFTFYIVLFFDDEVRLRGLTEVFDFLREVLTFLDEAFLDGTFFDETFLDGTFLRKSFFDEAFIDEVARLDEVLFGVTAVFF